MKKPILFTISWLLCALLCIFLTVSDKIQKPIPIQDYIHIDILAFLVTLLLLFTITGLFLFAMVGWLFAIFKRDDYFYKTSPNYIEKEKERIQEEIDDLKNQIEELEEKMQGLQAQ